MADNDKIVAEMISWIKSQKPLAPQMKDAPTFYRNLEEALDVRRSTQSMLTRGQNTWKAGGAIDFCSNDLLSLGLTGELRTEFLAELARHPDFALHSGGSRVMGGNYDYVEEVEQEIADFLGAETALMFNSGSNGNVAIYTSIPRSGDAIVYDGRNLNHRFREHLSSCSCNSRREARVALILNMHLLVLLSSASVVCADFFWRLSRR